MQNPRRVVGYADFRGRDCEGCVVRADNHIARQAKIARAAPNSSAYTGDNRDCRVLNFAQKSFHGHMKRQGIHSVCRQLVNIMPRAPNTASRLRLEHDTDALVIVAEAQRVHKLITHLFAKAIKVFGVLHFNIAYTIFNLGTYQHIQHSCNINFNPRRRNLSPRLRRVN